MHSLLERQLRRAKINPDTLPSDLGIWQEFLSRIERSYTNADHERQRLEENTKYIKIQSTTTLSSLVPPLSNVVAVMEDGLCVFDPQGQLLFLNSAAANTLNIQGKKFQQLNILECFELHDKVNPDVRLTSTELIQRLGCGQSFHDSNALLQRDNQPPLQVSCIFDPLLENQQLISIVLLFRDISEFKNVEAELIAAKETAE